MCIVAERAPTRKNRPRHSHPHPAKVNNPGVCYNCLLSDQLQEALACLKTKRQHETHHSPSQPHPGGAQPPPPSPPPTSPFEFTQSNPRQTNITVPTQAPNPPVHKLTISPPQPPQERGASQLYPNAHNNAVSGGAHHTKLDNRSPRDCSKKDKARNNTTQHDITFLLSSTQPPLNKLTISPRPDLPKMGHKPT